MAEAAALARHRAELAAYEAALQARGQVGASRACVPVRLQKCMCVGACVLVCAFACDFRESEYKLRVWCSVVALGHVVPWDPLGVSWCCPPLPVAKRRGSRAACPLVRVSHWRQRRR
jgi:hypothetical protein